MSVIANTTIMSSFSSAGKLQLLSSLWQQIYIPDQVFDEVQAGLAQGYTFYDGVERFIFPFSESGWLHLTSLVSEDEFRTFSSLLENLHSGEAACIAIACHRSWIFLSDDKAARKIANDLNIEVSGTVGVLLSLIKNKFLDLDDADEILDQMVRRGYRSPVVSLSEIINI